MFDLLTRISGPLIANVRTHTPTDGLPQASSGPRNRRGARPCPADSGRRAERTSAHNVLCYSAFSEQASSAARSAEPASPPASSKPWPADEGDRNSAGPFSAEDWVRLTDFALTGIIPTLYAARNRAVTGAGPHRPASSPCWPGRNPSTPIGAGRNHKSFPWRYLGTCGAAAAPQESSSAPNQAPELGSFRTIGSEFRLPAAHPKVQGARRKLGSTGSPPETSDFKLETPAEIGFVSHDSSPPPFGVPPSGSVAWASRP